MGAELIDKHLIPAVPWLDAATNRYLRRLIALAVSANPDVEAVILFGSAARRALRTMTDAEPSDVDVLFLMTASPDSTPPGRITREQHLAMARAEVAAYPATVERVARTVQTVTADPSFAGWDPSFPAGIVRDGVLLWARGALPAALAAIARRPLSAVASDPPG